MFFAQKVNALSICFDIRIDGIADTENSSPHNLESQIISADDQVNNENYKRELGSFGGGEISFGSR